MAPTVAFLAPTRSAAPVTRMAFAIFFFSHAFSENESLVRCRWLLLSWRVAEPVLEACRSETRAASRNEGVHIQFCAEVTGVSICGDLTCVPSTDQELAGDFVETERFWIGQVDHAVDWRSLCDID